MKYLQVVAQPTEREQAVVFQLVCFSLSVENHGGFIRGSLSSAVAGKSRGPSMVDELKGLSKEQ